MQESECLVSLVLTNFIKESAWTCLGGRDWLGSLQLNPGWFILKSSSSWSIIAGNLTLGLIGMM